MELIDYLRMLRRRWVWVVGLTLLGIGAGIAYSVLAPKTYAATAEIFVGSNLSGNDASVAAQSSSQFALDRMQSYVQLVDSPIVSGPVVRDLALSDTPTEFGDRVSASVPPKTVLLQVTARDSNPGLAEKIANVTATRLAATIEGLEAASGGGANPVNVTVTTRAEVPEVPASPNRTLAVAIGLVAGLGLGLLVASLRDQSARGRREHELGTLATPGPSPAVVDPTTTPQAPAGVGR